MKNDGHDNDPPAPRARVAPLAMHTIKPASLKPGATVASAPGGTAESAQDAQDAAQHAVRTPDTPGTSEASRLIRGRALIIWDAKIPGKKRDAIDTDQITPAADCVSESLEQLDERW